jgi:molybdopterin molybdotransferase
MAAPIPIEQAFAHVLKNSGSAPEATIALSDALGCYLAQDVKADRDWPPFNRSAVDGYAVFSSDTRSAPDVLEVIEEVPAGKAPTRALSPGQAIKIMTGAPVPAGADCVIMIERTEIPRPGFVRFMITMKNGQNLSRRGEDARNGDVVIKAGTRIGPAEIGVLAAVGVTQVPVRKPPLIAILGTGDEVVEPNITPGPAQIRNSNSHQLLAHCAANHLRTKYLGIAPDDRAATRKLIEEGLQADVLVTTGGVSIGEHDHVGAALKELGVEVFFNKVAIKPGKPLTFGRRGETLVFGLPGNPVAAFVCFHLFVLTAIRQRQGAAEPLPRWLSFPLSMGERSGGDRTTFKPARLIAREDGTWVESIEWHGSGHLAALVGIDGFFVQKPGEELAQGQRVTFYPI